MGLWSKLTRTVRRRQHDADIDEELRGHLEMEIAAGATARDARLHLGNPVRLHEEMRAAGIVEWLDSAAGDVRHGLRQLRRSPALALAVVLSLTIGIGANTAIFSLVDAALLKPLPVGDPGSLRFIEWTFDRFPPSIENVNGEVRSIAGNRQQGSSVSAATYRQLAREDAGFGALAGSGAYPDGAAIAVDGQPAEQISIQYVSSNYFDVLGVAPVVGRAFFSGEDTLGSEPIVVVSHRYWMNRLGGRADAIDRVVTINSVAARVVGVAPPSFFGLRPGQWPDAYAPLAAKAALQAGGGPIVENDRNWWVRIVARAQPSTAESIATARLGALFAATAFATDGERSAAGNPAVVAIDARRGLDGLNAADTRALWTLLLLVGVLMLVVCVNVATLLLARAVGRQRESALRLALGSSRLRLVRLHFIESLLLAGLGGAAGVAVGYWLSHALHALFQTGRDASSMFDLRLDPRVFMFAAGISMLAALLFGLAPAARAARTDLNDTLNSQSRSVAGGIPRLPRILVAVQIALCLAALVTAGLLGRSLQSLKSVDLGFAQDTLAYATVSPARAGYSPERRRPYVARVREAISGVPGVVSVSPIATRVLASRGNHVTVHIPGVPYRDGVGASLNGIDESYPKTFGIPLLLGRMVTAADARPTGGPVVVDESFVRKFLPAGDPIGRRFGFGPEDTQSYEVVGVIGNSRYNDLRREMAPTIYLPFEPGGTVNFAIRTTLSAGTVAAAVRQAVGEVDPAVPLTEFHTQAGLIDRHLRTERLLTVVSTAFGAIALTLAAIGLAGLLSYAVARRTNEIGVRLALGASRRGVVRMILRDSLRLVLIGTAVGLPCAYALGRLLRPLLYQLSPMDLPVTIGSITVLLIVALLAAGIPARRASQVDPMAALRQE